MIRGCLRLSDSSDLSGHTEWTNPVAVLPGYQVSAYTRSLSAMFNFSKWPPSLRKHEQNLKIQTINWTDSEVEVLLGIVLRVFLRTGLRSSQRSKKVLLDIPKVSFHLLTAVTLFIYSTTHSIFPA